jgi:hypothetical protein
MEEDYSNYRVGRGVCVGDPISEEEMFRFL